MKTPFQNQAIYSVLLLTVFSLAAFNESASAQGIDARKLKRGREVYEHYCVVCHGKNGDGKGHLGLVRYTIQRFHKRGLLWYFLPADFTLGVFKLRSTPTGCLPTDEDLMRTVTLGIPRSGMPSHKVLPEEDRRAVVEYIKTFSERWQEEEPCESITVPRRYAWVGSDTSAEKGKKLYIKLKCWECHGYTGEGNGPKADRLVDDRGNKVIPLDFTTGLLKRGLTPESLYLTFTTGFDGSGMPSYEDSLPDVQMRWHLVSYVLKLMGRTKSITIGSEGTLHAGE